MTIKVFGHKNPDTDSIVSAISMAEFLGDGAEACALGEPNPETRFVLDKFGLKAPSVLTSAAGEDVAIVDTTEPYQLPDDLNEANIKWIVDHHNLGGLKTNAPTSAMIFPNGSTNTIVFSLFKYAGRMPSKAVAGAMVCAILSDVVMFKSPTATPRDREAVTELSSHAGIDWQNVGMDMLRVKSSIEHEPAGALLNRDLKVFDFNGYKIAGGQIELVDMTLADSKIDDLRAEMKKLHEGGDLFGVMLMITDVMAEVSHVLLASNDNEKIARCFDAEIVDGDKIILPGVLSRKKQIVPPMLEKMQP